LNFFSKITQIQKGQEWQYSMFFPKNGKKWLQNFEPIESRLVSEQQNRKKHF